MECQNFSDSKKNKFIEIANRLLNYCFLLKVKNREDYLFVVQNKNSFNEIFEYIGYEIRILEQEGLIHLVNIFETGRLQFKKYESIILLILRLLYIEKKKEIRESAEIIVRIEELHEKYSLLNIKAKSTLDKALIKNTVSLFKKYNLIDNLDTDVTLDDSRLRIYPSILLAVPNDDIDALYKNAEEKLGKYSSGGISEDEIID